MKRARSFHPDPDPRRPKGAVEVRTGRVSACGRRCVEDEESPTQVKGKEKMKPVRRGKDKGGEHHTP